MSSPSEREYGVFVAISVILVGCLLLLVGQFIDQSQPTEYHNKDYHGR